MFRPARLEIAPGASGVFVDGAVSMANDPALLLFLVATLRGFPYRWPTGADRLLLVSVGAGSSPLEADPLVLAQGSALRWLAHLPLMLIQDGVALTELLLQAISRTPTRRVIDLEVGDLGGELLLERPVLDYLRYDVRLDAPGLQDLGAPDLVPCVRELRSLTGARRIPDLERLGRAGASRDVASDHFLPVYDLGASRAGPPAAEAR
jgi:hypothetical protein